MSTPEPPRRRAAALRYTGATGAPEVIASGSGELAERIVERAAQAGVPVREDPALAEALASLAIGDRVPEELWTAVAQVLAWAYSLEGRITTNR